MWERRSAGHHRLVPRKTGYATSCALRNVVLGTAYLGGRAKVLAEHT